MVAISALSFVLIAVAAHTRQVAAHGRRQVPGPSQSTGEPSVRTFGPKDVAERPRPFLWHLPHLPWLLSILGELAVLAVVLGLVLLLVRVVPHLSLWPQQPKTAVPVVMAPEASQAELAARVGSTFDAAIAGFRRGDREAAIIACWLRLEEIVGSAGYPRQNSETSSELASRWLNVLPLSEQPLGELGELYREARFSRHRMSDEAVSRARQALTELHTDLVGSRSLLAGG
ncbi:MAG: DUF4129 domain-containing protein [Jatrophihabitans sp.]